MQNEFSLRRCRDCGAHAALQGYACRACGSLAFDMRDGDCLGTVRALSTVHRAPDDFWKAYTPYVLALVRLREGATRMGHVAPEVRVGDTVRGAMVDIGGRQVMRFTRAQEQDTAFR